MTLLKKTKSQLITEVKKLQSKNEFLNKKSPQTKNKPWASVFEYSANTMAVIDKQLTIIDINKRSQRKAIGRKAYDFNPKDFKIVKKAIEKVFKTAKTQVYTVESLSLTGKVIYNSCKATPIFEKGKVVFVIVEATDITKEIEALNFLKQSEGKFKMLADNSIDVVYRFKILPKPKYEYVSPSVTAVSGYTPKEFYADSYLGFKIVHPDDAYLLNNSGKILKKNNKRKSIKEPRIILRWIKKDGNIIWTETRNTHIFDSSGKFIAIEGISRDITQQKENEEKLKESERTLSTLMNNLRGMAYRCDYDDKWTMRFISQGFLQLTGYPPKKFIHNRQSAFADIIHPEDRSLGIDKIKYAIANQVPFEIEYRIITKKKEIKWVWEKGEGVFSKENGKLLFLEGFITDVNDKKQYELEITQS
nr:PAS domain-containing protein [Bacteroidota bacterium]